MSLSWRRLAAAAICAGALACGHTPAPPVEVVSDGIVGNLPPCARTADAADPTAIAAHKVGHAISARGVLVPAAGGMMCTLRACFRVDGEPERAPEHECCNHCSADVELRPATDVNARRGDRPAVRIRLRGENTPLQWSGMDCEAAAAVARAHPEVIVRGMLASEQFETGAAPVIEDAELCATGAWSQAPPVPAPKAQPRVPHREHPNNGGPVELPAPAPRR